MTNRDFPTDESLRHAKHLSLAYATLCACGTMETEALAGNVLIEHLLASGVVSPLEAPRIWLGCDGFSPREGAPVCHHVFVNIVGQPSAIVIACDI